jgi:pyruvate dehydrogenase complex dehydrogenase (E1) component
MAYSNIENLYLNRQADMVLPPMPEEPMGEEALQLAAGPAASASDAGNGLPSLKSYDPTTREKLADFLQAGFERVGLDRYRARKQAETLIGGPNSNLPLELGLADIVPFLGTALQTEEAVRMGEDAVAQVKEGNYGMAAAEAVGAGLGLLPGGVATGKAVKAAARAAKKGAK